MPQDAELRWIEDGAVETRADVCQVKSTRDQTMLLFGTRLPEDTPRARLERRIVIAPLLAKQLAATLAEALRAREAQLGFGNATPAGSIRSAPRDADAPAAARPLLELVRALGEITDDDREVVATVLSLLASGQVRLCGNFRNAPIEDFSI